MGKTYRISIWNFRTEFIYLLGFTLVLLLLNGRLEIKDYLLSILIGAVCFFFMFGNWIYAYRFGPDRLIVKGLFAKDFPYTNVKRAIVREAANSFGGTGYHLTLSSKQDRKTLEVDVRKLKDYDKFLRELEARARFFPVIYQNQEGVVLRRVELE